MNTVLQQQLRNAGEQVEGTGNLLLQAADEINNLKRQLASVRAQVDVLQTALVKVRADVNTTIDKTLGTKKTDG